MRIRVFIDINWRYTVFQSLESRPSSGIQTFQIVKKIQVQPGQMENVYIFLESVKNGISKCLESFLESVKV